MTSETSATFGPTTLGVTTYAANSLPVTVSACGSPPFTLIAFSLQVAASPGMPMLVTQLVFSGVGQLSNGTVRPQDITINLISITKA